MADALASGGGHSPEDNFKVAVRVRPPLHREIVDGRFNECVSVEGDRSVCISDGSAPFGLELGDGIPKSPSGLDALFAAQSAAVAGDATSWGGSHRFTFDAVYGPESHQEDVYDSCAKPAVLSTLAGYNATMIAYGQTGTGKTFTMQGAHRGELRGIIPRAIEDVFASIESGGDANGRFLVRAAYLQVYNEVICDLLKPERTNLVIREDRRRGVFVEGLSEWVVRSPEAVRLLMERGAQQRATGATRMNELSSRSHAVFVVVVENARGSLQPPQGAAGASAATGDNDGVRVRVGKLNLVDLAGSERVSLSGAAGQRLEETKKINQSLSALGNVIAALTDPRGRPHIPYRDSKLTRLLTDSLGGNCRTTMICHVSPALEAFSEGLSTLKFASRAKQIRNEAHINEDLDQKALLRKMELELRRLRAELKERSTKLVDKRKLLEVEEKRKQAEHDKMKALTELQALSRDFLAEKQEKAELEARIKSMQSQLLVGGGSGGDEWSSGAERGATGAASPEVAPSGRGDATDAARVRQLLKREHQRIRGEYESKLEALERERDTMEEDRAQVSRYKSLLMKQRDIMIALTQRLAERDEHIGTLQEELEAFDERVRGLEDALDEKTVALIGLRRAAAERLGPHVDLESAAVMPSNNAAAVGIGRTESDLTLQMHGAMLVRGDSGDPVAMSTAHPLPAPASSGEDGSVLLRAASLPAPSLETSALEEENRALVEQVETHKKERAALRTIMEQKVAGLVGNLVSKAEAARKVEEAGQEYSAHTEEIGREARALQRLVAATVKALSQVT